MLTASSHAGASHAAAADIADKGEQTRTMIDGALDPDIPFSLQRSIA